MEQMKILDKQMEIRPLAEQGGMIDAENGKLAYVAPEVSVVYVQLESTIAASISGSGGSTTTVEDWTTVDPDTSDSGDLSL
jgi:hypothetical protein